MIPNGTLRLCERHANITVMKAKGWWFRMKLFVGVLGDAMSVIYGHGGLELRDNIFAAYADMIPALDCTNIQKRIFDALAAGDLETANSPCARALPHIVFSMQSLDVAILYSKRMFARRADQERLCMPGAGAGASTLLDEATERWSAAFGPGTRKGAALFNRLSSIADHPLGVSGDRYCLFVALDTQRHLWRRAQPAGRLGCGGGHVSVLAFLTPISDEWGAMAHL
jgi:hypothetical protein